MHSTTVTPACRTVPRAASASLPSPSPTRQADDDTLSASGEWACNVSPRRLARRDRPESIWRAPISAHMRVRQYDLSELFRAMHRHVEVASTFTGVIDVAGTLDDPDLRTQGIFVPLPTPGYAIPPTSIDVAYRDDLLRIERVEVSKAMNANVAATVPMSISFRDGARILSDRPMEGSIVIEPLADGALSDFAPYVKGVSKLQGILTGRVQASGTPSSPRLTGAMTLTNGELRVTGVTESATDISARVDFVDDVVRLTSLTAKSGDEGSLIATGWARVSNYKPADYQVDISARDFPLQSIPDVELVLGGKVRARMTTWRGEKIPMLTGNVIVKEAIIMKDLGSASGSAATELALPTDRPDWLANIDIDAPKNVWIRNPDLNVELASDELVFLRDERGMYFRGELLVLRGSYKLYGNKFTITSGTMDFSASETLRPSMHIEAYTPYRGGSTDAGNIYLVLSWPYDKVEPQISLSYDEPGYSEIGYLGHAGR